MKELDPVSLASGYRASDREFRIQQAKIGCILVLTCMPLGTLLDWYVYPALLPEIFVSRIACDLAVLPLFWLLFTERGRAHVDVLAFAWPLLPGVAISWMVYASQGPASPYYAGLCLVLIVACELMPYTLWEALGVCGATLALYLTAILAHAIHRRTNLPTSILVNNVYFISLTALICVTACHSMNKRRMKEFALRFELDVRNREISESYAKLAELDRLKSEFFANISHELRTPLTLILAPAHEILRGHDGVPAFVSERLEIVYQNALRLLKVINDLLELVRLDEGCSDLRREPIDLAEFVAAMVGSVRHLALAKGVTITANRGEALPVVGDSARLEKVILNLLTNAIKFTPRGGSVMTYAMRQGSLAVVEVEDNGIGIPADALPRIFDRFHQVDGSSTRKYQGAGIGLALANDLVRAHGGRLTARSIVGKGTTFRLELSIASGDAPAAAERLPDGATDVIQDVYQAAERIVSFGEDDCNASLEPVGEGLDTILIVDDEPDMRRFLTTLLAPDHRVLRAANGRSGLEVARSGRPQLVLLDLMLPELDGLQVCEAIRADPQIAGMKVILLTARADEGSKIAALERGADDFLTKPFSSIEVKTRLANLLRVARLEQDLRRQNGELQLALKQLKETQAQLVHSEKLNAVGKLSAGLLHEVNNPLTFAKMATQLAQREIGGNDLLRDALDDVAEGLSRIGAVISDLRAFAHPSTGAVNESVGICDVVDSARRLVAHELEGVEVDASGLSPHLVRGSKTQLMHVLMNLLVNAAQAIHASADARDPRITVYSRVDRDRVNILVRDNGPGITADVLPHVFEPFFTTKEVGSGLGLGLSICHTIVASHGGKITITTETGAGTEVGFDLALAARED